MTDASDANTEAVGTISSTGRAQAVLGEIAADQDDEVAIILNDGCCDGMGPVLVTRGMVGVNDVRIGAINDIDVFVPSIRAQSRKGYDLLLDVSDAKGAGSFSLEVPYGYRLTIKEQRYE